MVKFTRNVLVSFWDKADNKKTITGFILWIVYGILVNQGILVEDTSIVLAINGLIGVGVIHKVQKVADKL